MQAGISSPSQCNLWVYFRVAERIDITQFIKEKITSFKVISAHCSLDHIHCGKDTIRRSAWGCHWKQMSVSVTLNYPKGKSWEHLSISSALVSCALARQPLSGGSFRYMNIDSKKNVLLMCVLLGGKLFNSSSSRPAVSKLACKLFRKYTR